MIASLGRRTKALLFTRDSVCMGDDEQAPHARWLDVPADADVATVAHTLLHADYLACVGSRASWSLTINGDRIEFGYRDGEPYVDSPESQMSATAEQAEQIHVSYHGQT